MRIPARVLGKIRFRVVRGTKPCLFPNVDVIITKYADLNKRVGETVAVRGELKRLNLFSVLVVDGGLSYNPTVGHFRYRQDKWRGGDSDRLSLRRSSRPLSVCYIWS